VLDVEGEPVPLEEGQAVFVPARARHQFTAYEHLTVLVIFARRWRIDSDRGRLRTPA
jgi:mannose-6-phosphate isomerase-like protein (cupin superfamily)